MNKKYKLVKNDLTYWITKSKLQMLRLYTNYVLIIVQKLGDFDRYKILLATCNTNNTSAYFKFYYKLFITNTKFKLTNDQKTILLCESILSGNYKMVTYMIHIGADIHGIYDPKIPINDIPLYIALRKGFIKAIRFLLYKNIDVTRIYKCLGYQPVLEVITVYLLIHGYSNKFSIFEFSKLYSLIQEKIQKNQNYTYSITIQEIKSIQEANNLLELAKTYHGKTTVIKDYKNKGENNDG